MKTTFAQHIVRQALFAAVLAGIALSCLASCSKSAPETPMERSRVLLRIFDNLERRDNEEALKSIETYRNLDPTNEFLSNFEHIVRENSVIASAKAKLDADDITEAAAVLNVFCRKYGKDSSDPRTNLSQLIQEGIPESNIIIIDRTSPDFSSIENTVSSIEEKKKKYVEEIKKRVKKIQGAIGVLFIDKGEEPVNITEEDVKKINPNIKKVSTLFIGPVVDAKNDVNLLLEALRLNGKMLVAEFSDDKRDAAAELQTFAQDNSTLFPNLSAYAATKIKEAEALAVVEKADACAAILQDAMDASSAGRKSEAATLTAILEMNADAAQTAGFEAWLKTRPAKQ